ncbi:MAG: LptF/LptG family permease [bacterium]|nr:LptF/LptG family permease [bacterium]
MKILYRYFTKEYLSSFLLGLFIFTFIFIMDKIFILSEFLVTKHVAFFSIIKLFAYYLPATFAITIPMGVLTAVLITWGKLSANNEITAIKAVGISLNSLIYLALFLGFSFFLLNAILNDTLLPCSNHAYKSLYYQIVQKKPAISIEEQVFTKIGNKEIYVNKIDNKRNTIKGIYLYEKIKEEDGDILFRYIFAKSGCWKGTVKSENQDKVLALKDGTIHQTLEKEKEKYHIMKFNTHEVIFNSQEETYSEEHCKGLREMTSKELREKIKEYKERNIDINLFLVELYKKISIPFACIVFTLVGTPLGLLAKKSGKSIGLGFSILIIFFYYLFLICGETLGKKGILIPLFSMWFPNIVLGFAGIILCIFAIRR